MTNLSQTSAEYFEAKLRTIVEEIRRDIDEALLPNVRFDIEVRGRSADPNIKIEFLFYDTEYGSSCTRGANLYAAVRETIRRQTWDKEHKRACLPAPD